MMRVVKILTCKWADLLGAIIFVGLLIAMIVGTITPSVVSDCLMIVVIILSFTSSFLRKIAEEMLTDAGH